ncbi:MAG: DUF4388 domain-containing protein [Clostridia bacterium]|nr:DUF4388 domain-containing protein [Deltaproteobacteria bacterium]
MAIHGDLITLPLADLLSWLRSTQRSGVLTVRRDGAEWELELVNGRVKGYSGPETGTDLGQIIVTSGLITEADLRAALEHQRRNDGSLRQSIVKLGIMSPQQLDACLTELATESLYDLFLDLPGTFVFSDASERGVVITLDDDEERLTLDLDVNHLLMEGARRQDEWGHIRKRFPHDDVTVRIIDDKLSELDDLGVRELRILASLAAGQTVSDICFELRAPVPSVLRTLADLEATGAVKIIAASAKEEKSGRFEDLMQQATTLRQAGQFDEAIAVLEAAVRMRPDSEGGRAALKETLEEQINQLYASLPPLKVPVVVDEGRLRRMSLRPEERFLVDRLSAHMDVGSLIMVSSLNERETLKMLRKLVHSGIVELR